MTPELLGYKGQSEIDTGYFFCPFIPGMSSDQIMDISARLLADKGPTEIQLQIMDAVKNSPTK